MANRFWVGGTGTWDASTTTHWSTSSGGAGGASVPTATDSVFFNGSSGGGTVTISGTRSLGTLDSTGFTGAFSGGVLNLSGVPANVTLGAGMSSPNTTDFQLAGTTTTFTSNGKQIHNLLPGNSNTTLGDNLNCAGSLQMNNSGTFDANGHNVSCASVSTAVAGATLLMGSGAWTLTGTGTVWDATNLIVNPGAATIAITDASGVTKTFKGGGIAYTNAPSLGSAGGTVAFDLGSGSLTLGGNISTAAAMELVSGSFNANGKTVSCAAFKADVSAIALTLGGGQWTLTGTGTVWNILGGALTPDTTKIVINDASAASKTFAGGSKTYYDLQLTGAGTGAFIVTGSNTFRNFTLDTPPHTLQFQDGTTNIATSWAFSGSAGAGNNILESISGGTWDIVCVAGVSASYVTLQGSHAHGGAFTASNSFDAGDNLFWNFVRSATTAVYFDSAYQYDGVSTSTLSGLNWLWGETVGVVADGVDIDDATIDTHGNLTLPGGVTASVITIGKRYQSYGKTLRAPQSGNQDGSSLGRQMAIKTVFADILNSAGLMVGTLTDVQPIPPDWRQVADGSLYTGMFQCPTDDSYFNNGVIVFQTDRGYPCTLRALQMGIESEP